MEMLWLDPHKLVGSPPMFLLPSGKTRTTQLGLGDAEISQHGILRLREEDVPSVGTRHREAQSVEKGGKNKQHNTTMDKKQSFLFMIFFCIVFVHIIFYLLFKPLSGTMWYVFPMSWIIPTLKK